MIGSSSAFLGAFIGSFVFSLIIGPLDDAYRLYPDDMAMWWLYSVPAGAIFGSITGLVLGLAAEKKDKAAASMGITSGLGLALFHLMVLLDAMHRSSPLFTQAATTAYAYARCGPGLLWACLIFAFGLRCYKSSRTPT
jgi:hypothetical protein